MNRLQYLYIVPLLLLLSKKGTAQNVPDAASTAVSGPATNFIEITPPSFTPPNGKLNYIRTFIPKVPITQGAFISESSTSTTVLQNTVYKDGFNRPIMEVKNNFIDVSGTMKHLIQPFDTRFRLEGINFLPYTDDAASFSTNPVFNQKAYYSSMYPDEQQRGFSATVYQSDANTRQSISYDPGLGYVGQGRGTTSKSSPNTAGQVRIWTLNSSGVPVSNAYYPASTLYGTSITDADGGNVLSYTDKTGKLICKIQLQKTTVSGTNVLNTYGTTYYVYDEMGRIKCTLPPKAVDLFTGGTLSTSVMDNLCFQYRYANGLLVEERKPGEGGFTSYVYDRKKRLVMRQTPVEATGTKKWEVTFYDKNNRVIATSIYQSNNSRAASQTLINAGGTPAVGTVNWYLMTPEGEGQYPPLDQTIADNTVMSHMYYDNYSLSDPGNLFWDEVYGNYRLFSNEMVTTPTVEEPIRKNRTEGMLTGNIIRILPSPTADLHTTGEWKRSVFFYDGKGRAINTITYDLYQSTPIHKSFASIQYDFNNRILISKQLFINYNSEDGTTEHKELTLNEYDPITGRLTAIQHKMDNGVWQVLGKFSYDGMGRLRKNILGNYGEMQDLTYNIRGQLTGINELYAETANKQNQSRSFGESLKYDYGFTQKKYDGNISGMLWRGSNAGKEFSYGYTYDKASRLIQSDFMTKNNGAASWNNTALDYSVSNLQYDLNGNLQSMVQKGPSGGAFTTIDNLTYNYESQSNRLSGVADAVTTNDLVGDFRSSNGNATDYSYDLNGNLTSDQNKGITSITYTHLNKPSVIVFEGDGKRIEYSYDITGNKIQEIILDHNVVSKTSDYISSFVYENNKVQFTSNKIGRTIFEDGTLIPKEEFFVKDHLGNVRSMVDVYTYPILDYLATYELASANLENLYFDNIDGVRDNNPGSTFNNNFMSARLNGAEPDRQIGTSLLTHVMAGDKVEMNVNNFYENYDENNDSPVAGEDILAGIISTLTGGVGGFEGSESHDTKMVNDLFTGDNWSAFQDIVTNQATDPTRPRAYLNYVLFDEQMKVVQEMSGAYQVSGGNNGWTPIGTVEPLSIPANGYLAVYLSNSTVNTQGCQTCGDVFFDQLQIRFTRGSLKEENHYYPFGLPMAGMGSVANGIKPNKRKYQSNEYNKELGLNWMDFHNRQYDPQLGRFLSVDPKAGETDYQSSYAGMDNNPVNVMDPFGLQGLNLSHTPYQGYSGVTPAGLGTLPGEKKPWQMAETDPNAPGGANGWYNDVAISIANSQVFKDAVKAASKKAGNEFGYTREELDAMDYEILREDGTAYLTRDQSGHEQYMIKGDGNTTWESSGFKDFSVGFTPVKGLYSAGLYIPKAGMFVLGTKTGRMLGMGGGYTFNASPYSMQKLMIAESRLTLTAMKTGGRALGEGAAVIQIAGDLVGNYDYIANGSNSPDAISPIQTINDIGFSYIGIYGGIPGMAISTAYFYFSPVIYGTHGSAPPIIVPTVDATYVAPR